MILDPVGAGASKLRTETALQLIGDVRFSVIRGNVSEIKALALGSVTTKGVDADKADAVTAQTLEGRRRLRKTVSKKTGAVIAITGAVDIVTDGGDTYLVRNGHPMISRITGSGCNADGPYRRIYRGASAVSSRPRRPAVGAMGLSGERAFESLKKPAAATRRSAMTD